MELEKYKLMDINNPDIIILKRRDNPQYRIAAVPTQMARGLTMDYRVNLWDSDRKEWRYDCSLHTLTEAHEHIEYLIRERGFRDAAS